MDTASLAQRGWDPAAYATALIAGGARWLQFRHKEPFTSEAFEWLARVAIECRAAGARLVVNDRADMAAICDAGLHVGQMDLPPELARRVIGGRVLGFSTHDEKELRAAATEPVDYLGLGPIFQTGSKADAGSEVGLANLRQWRQLTAKPLVAIGGITIENATAVLDAGADSVAVIAALMDGAADLSAVEDRMRTWTKQLA